MSALNGRNGMNGNRKSLFLCCGLAVGILVLASTPAFAQSSGMPALPALANIKEIIVQSPRTASTSSSKRCDIKAEELQSYLVKTLRNYELPGFSLLEAKPARMDTARVELVPEVITSNAQAADCTSWVSLTLQSLNSLRVPPIETPRSVVVTYWRGGLMVSSVELTHARVIANAFEKLIHQLSNQYRLDQPPPLPTFEEDKTLEDIMPKK